MHQQVRTSIRKSLADGFREQLDEESLIDILTLLKVKNLRSAGRMHVEGGDEFVFSVRHRKGDNKPDEDARNLLQSSDYEARVCEVRNFLLDDREGALLERIEQVEAEMGEPVIEVHVLTSEPNRKVPVQLVTQSMLDQ
jgi:hypothetical protein